MSREMNDAFRQFLEMPLPVGPAPSGNSAEAGSTDPELGSALYDNLQITLDKYMLGYPTSISYNLQYDLSYPLVYTHLGTITF